MQYSFCPLSGVVFSILTFVYEETEDYMTQTQSFVYSLLSPCVY